MLSPHIELDFLQILLQLMKQWLYYFRKIFPSLPDHKIHWALIKNINFQATPRCSELESPVTGPGNVCFYKRNPGNSHDWVTLRNTVSTH